MEPSSQDVVSQVIGEFGRWQFTLTFLLSLVNFPCTFHIFSPTFQAKQLDYWCARPDRPVPIDVDAWKNLSGKWTLVNGKQEYSACEVRLFDVDNLSSLNMTSDSVFRDCDRWEFYSKEGDTTIIQQWNLVCSNEHYVSLAETMFLIGVALGGIFSGYFSDRFGRKTALLLSLALQISIGLVLAVTESFAVYMVGRAMLGFVCVSVVFSGFVLCMELVGGKWLTISGVSYLFPLPFAYMVIAALAFYIRDWRHLQYTITLSSVPFLSFWWIMPESPRWLLAKGQVDKTIRVLEDAARSNKITLPSNIDKMLKQSAPLDSESAAGSNILDLFRTPAIRRISLILYVVWFSTYLVYYGLVLNLSNLGGNVYVNSIISGAVEFPAILGSIFILLKLGRRLPLSLSLIGAGIACMMTTPVPKELDWLTILLAMVGKFCVSSSNVVMPVFTAELFPTVMRNLGVGSSNVPAGVALIIVPFLWKLFGVGLSNVPAGVALIIVPFLWKLQSVMTAMPMMVLGTFGIIGGLAVLLLPETNDAGLVDTVEQVREKPGEVSKS